MPNYQQAKLYVIRSPSMNEVYIGTTCEPTLARRMAGHRTNSRRWKKGKTTYTSSCKLLALGDAYIELIEAYPCNSKDELHRREGELIRTMPDCVNNRIAGRSKYEYRHDNAKQIAIKYKQYYQANAEKIKAHRSKKYECDCGGRYNHNDKSKHLRTIKHKEFEAFMSLTEEQVQAILY